MYNLYENISSLCKMRGITVYKMCKDLGIRGSVLSDLNCGRKKGLSADTLSKIADYFDVSVDFLLGNGKKATSSARTDNELFEILQEFRDNPELKTLFLLLKNATPKELRQYAKIIKTLRDEPDG